MKKLLAISSLLLVLGTGSALALTRTYTCPQADTIKLSACKPGKGDAGKNCLWEAQLGASPKLSSAKAQALRFVSGARLPKPTGLLLVQLEQPPQGALPIAKMRCVYTVSNQLAVPAVWALPGNCKLKNASVNPQGSLYCLASGASPEKCQVVCEQ